MAEVADWIQNQLDVLEKSSFDSKGSEKFKQAASAVGNVKRLVAASLVYQLVLKTGKSLTTTANREKAAEKIKDAMPKNNIELEQQLSDRLTVFVAAAAKAMPSCG